MVKDVTQLTNINGKVIIITGASSGIGQAAAKLLADKGAKLVLAARREDRLKELQLEIEKAGGTAVFKATDVTSREQMKALAEEAVSQFGQIDGLVNNAGLMPLSYMNKLKIDEWDQMIDVNIKGVLYGIAAVLPHMEERRQGHIINISSLAGHEVGIGHAVYSGTKFAVRAISEGLRKETYDKNIRTTIISPGAVSTELSNTITDPDIIDMFNSGEPFTFLEGKDIANAICYALEQPEYVAVDEVIVRPAGQP
ncbi:SDR family oxidoreductase [Scopulibacillus cellulosilyticus]|uniref:SDR family oxidoreductase n=1 Tax=Scopulibacillus cellulosilyticus TaxID=2665665 RepID=A0ABW2Q679_9BACL